MAQHDKGTATVYYLRDAKVGDTVWLFDSQMSLHDEAGKYLGRGVWRLVEIEGENRASFFVYRSKYDRKTGAARGTGGYFPSMFLFGEREKQDREWRQTHKHKLVQYIESLSDTELRRIAGAIGWVP